MSPSSSAPPHRWAPKLEMAGSLEGSPVNSPVRVSETQGLHHGSPPFPAQPPLAVSQTYAPALSLHSPSELPQIWGSPHSSNKGNHSMSQGSEF